MIINQQSGLYIGGNPEYFGFLGLLGWSEISTFSIPQPTPLCGNAADSTRTFGGSAVDRTFTFGGVEIVSRMGGTAVDRVSGYGGVETFEKEC